eukprot:gene19670-biopygen990
MVWLQQRAAMVWLQQRAAMVWLQQRAAMVWLQQRAAMVWLQQRAAMVWLQQRAAMVWLQQRALAFFGGLWRPRPGAVRGLVEVCLELGGRRRGARSGYQPQGGCRTKATSAVFARRTFGCQRWNSGQGVAPS